MENPLWDNEFMEFWQEYLSHRERTVSLLKQFLQKYNQFLFPPYHDILLLEESKTNMLASPSVNI
jgi:hypothetical protein